MYKFFLFLISFSFLTVTTVSAQLSAPEVAGVYGGRVNAIEIIPLDSSSIRIFVSTESANSLFYQDVDFSSPDGPTGEPFVALPDANEDDNLGGNIRLLSADWNSGTLFFINEGTLYSISTAEGSRVEVAQGVSGVRAYDGYLFYLTNEPGLTLHFGAVDSSDGSFTEDGDSPLSVSTESVQNPNGLPIYINPVNGRVYLAWMGLSEPANIYKSSAPYDSLDKSTTFDALPTTGLGSYSYGSFGMGPDGRFFAGTTAGEEPNHSKFIAWTDDDGATWDTLSTGIGGGASGTITCGTDSTDYPVYFGSAYSTSKGADGTWKSIGWQGFETHPNDGPAGVVATVPGMVVFTTDMGVGASMDFGASIFEINDGLEAVQIADFDMTHDKNDAWVASKSGIRRVTNYASADEEWQVYFPMGDGSPYYSVAVDKENPDTAFAGNIRVYRTFDGGANWEQVFRMEDFWNTDFDFFSYISDIDVHPDSGRFVVWGVNSPSSGVRGAVFYSFDYGNTYHRVDTDVYNTEVTRLTVVPVDADSFTVFVACDYVSDGTTSSYGVKTIGFRFSDESAHFSNDMIGESGGDITNFGANDIKVNEFGDVVVAGYNSSEQPRVYGKQADSTAWVMFSTAGFPENGRSSAVSWGYDAYDNQVPYVAVNNTLYALDSTYAKWNEVYTYPTGNQVNVLYWDDLLVGTGTGLYEQYLSPTGIKDLAKAPGSFELLPNYPNPFNPSTQIVFRLGVNSLVELTVYDVLGRRVQTLVHEARPAGLHRVSFNAEKLAAGVYFYRLKARPVNGGHAFVDTRRMLLLK